ncbi:hypothetical protein DITRI_Ditri03aG0223000 [Diplodiscus trichospermus]
MLSLPFLLAPIRILLCRLSIFNHFLSSTSRQSSKLKGWERKREAMITRSNLAEQLREYQLRSKHDWASVSFFSSTSNLTSSRHMQLAFILVCVTMLLLLCMKISKQVRLARKKKRRMLLPLSM